MNPNKLKSRMKFVKGKALPDRAQALTTSRRSAGSISPETSSDPEDKFETFFDYEEELSGLKPSSEQFSQMIEEDTSMVMEEIDSFDKPEVIHDFQNNEIDNNAEDKSGFIIMEDATPIILESDDDKKIDNSNNNNGLFEFIRCDFIKDDGNRCKRQAPKGSTICSVHKKYLKKRNLK